jgi:hypothetical protein
MLRGYCCLLQQQLIDGQMMLQDPAGAGAGAGAAAAGQALNVCLAW